MTANYIKNKSSQEQINQVILLGNITIPGTLQMNF